MRNLMEISVEFNLVSNYIQFKNALFQTPVPKLQ